MRRLTVEPGPGGAPDGRLAARLSPVVTAVTDPATTLEELADRLREAVQIAGEQDPAASVELEAEPAPDALDEVARAAGLELTRTLLQLRRPLPVPPADRGTAPTDPVVVRSFRPGDDDDGWLEVNNRAFAWHPEQSGWTKENLAEREAEPWFRADGFLIHERAAPAGPEGIDGFCWTKIHADHDPPLGEIYVIGVDPDAHGQGLGRALTLAGLDWLAGQGLTVGMLYVEADNDSAVHLYRDLGFTEHLVHRWWRTPR